VKRTTVPYPLVRKIAAHIIGHYLPRSKEYQLGLYFVGEREMIRLNRQFFKRDYATDVIASPVERESELPVVALGDVFVCTGTARRQAKEYGHSYREEIALLTTHGILHLLGYDDLKPADRKKMRAEEQKVLRAVVGKK
jgi:probable rRNA maturation factor